MRPETPSEPAKSPWASRAAWLLLFALLAVNLGASAFWLFRDTGPRLEAFLPAASWLRTRVKPSDRIFLVPAYATRARQWLGDHEVVATKWPERLDLSGIPQVFVWSLYGEGAQSRAKLEAKGLLWQEGYAAGGIQIDRFQNPNPGRLLFDFMAEIGKAEVLLRENGQETPCRRARYPGPGWSCPKNSGWQYVAVEWHQIGDHLRRCLWAHPPNQGELVIRYRDVPLWGSLRGFLGHTLMGSAHAQAPVQLGVTWDHAPEQIFWATPRAEPWPFRLAAPQALRAAPEAEGQRGTLSWRIRTENAGMNHFCFSAQIWEAP